MFDKLVVIEGIDCSGKTTFLESLKSDGEAALNLTQPTVVKVVLNQEFNPFIKVCKKHIVELTHNYPSEKEHITNSWVNLWESATKEIRLRKPLEDKGVGKLYIVDRWLSSTLTYSSPKEQVKVLKNLLANRIASPNLTIVLKISYETFKERLNKRGNPDSIEISLLNNPKLFEETQEQLIKYSKDTSALCLVVDVDNYTKAEVKLILCQMIKSVLYT